MPNLLDRFRTYVDSSISASMSSPQPSVFIRQPEELQKRHFDEGGDEKLGRKGLLMDPLWVQSGSSGLFRPKRGSIHNDYLKLIARANPVVGIIIGTMAAGVMGACRKQTDHYDLGYVVKPTREDIQTDTKEVEELEDYIWNCGIKEHRREEDKMTFDRWAYNVTWDFARFGYCTLERDYTDDDRLYSFLPLPAGSMYYADPNTTKEVYRQEADVFQAGLRHALRDFEPMDPEDQDTEGQIKYVQMVNGRAGATFTSKELIFSKLTDDNDLDLNGYPISPLNKAIDAVTNHLKVEKHQSMFFTHGMASRGILVLKGNASPQTVQNLQRQWSQVTGSQNAWRTPVLGGLTGADWINLQPSNRDMEFAAYQDHLLRLLHSAFMISPVETGFEYLSRGTEQRSMSESSNEWKLTASRDRWLRPILNRIEAIINEEVLPRYSKALSEKYRFCFVGLDAETREEETTRLAGEVALHTTLNEARKEAAKNPLPIGGNLILNPLLIQTLQSNMTKGMFMELFLGVEGASQRPDLQYIPDPLWFQWQQFQMQMAQMQAGVDQEGEGSRENLKSGKRDGDEKQNREDEAKKAEALSEAAQQFMEANPDLFRSMTANLAKSERLAKNKALHAKIHPIGQHMMSQYRKAGDRLVADILGILKEDVLDKDRKESPN